MTDKTFDLIKKMTELQGTSGFEHNVREVMRAEMTPLVDEIVQDGLGGIFGIKHSKVENAPRVMVAAHMDEVGFLVAQITEQGLLRVVPLGGWNPYVVSAQRFTLQTAKGDYPVVSSSIPPHLLRDKGPQSTLDVKDILFDAGFDSKEEAMAYGVRPGDSIVPDVETRVMANGKKIVGKSWDNRYGCTVVIETLRALKDVELPITLIMGANVQEEVGLRGTKGAVHQLKPDLFFAVDCSAADDLTGDKSKYGHLGEGFLLRIFDPGMITLKSMRNFLIETAEAKNIPYQYFVSQGGTDAGASHMMNNGIPSAVIGVCARYIHTHQTVYHMDDYLAAKAMVLEVVKKLDRKTVDEMIQNA